VTAASFSQRLVGASRPAWRAMAARPFVLGLAGGTLPAAAWHAWVPG
jgi:thiaminase